MKTQIEKYHAFFNSLPQNGNVTQSLFTVSGGNASGGGSTALTATLAAGALVSATSNRLSYVNNLWNIAQQSGSTATIRSASTCWACSTSRAGSPRRSREAPDDEWSIPKPCAHPRGSRRTGVQRRPRLRSVG